MSSFRMCPWRSLLYMFIVSSLIVAGFAILFRSNMDFSNPEALLASVFVFDQFFIDFLLVTVVGMWLINLPGILRISAYVWFSLFAICYMVQFFSVYVGGEFVSFLAVDNVNHIDLLFDAPALVPLTIVLVATAGLVWFIETGSLRRAGWMHLTMTSIVLIMVAVVIHHHDQWVAETVLAKRDSFYQHKNNYMAHHSPLYSLYTVLYSDRKSDARPLVADDIHRAREYGIYISLNQRYPLAKEWIYREPLPFESVGNPAQLPNIIVFFSEGLAARTVNAYDDQFEGLTPNITEFSRFGMKVINYFNHTFATYRGLHGQLCSFYPTYGGLGGWHTDYSNLKNVSYYCLNNVLNEVGYQTMFLDTHRADSAFLDEMMNQLGFDRVITAEYVSQYFLNGEEPRRGDALSDNQLMTGLVELLRALEEDSSRKKPFFLGIYNLQTHAFQKLAADGIPYEDGSNHVLNAIHNYDHAFGEFWRYFRQSGLLNNTIVIFTADHTHYPEREFVSAVGQNADYTPVFVDRIPLIIYDQGKKLPEKFDANYASSIDFTPSLIHWLGLENRPNPFVGQSIFDQQRRRSNGAGRSIAAGGDQIFLVNRQGIYKKGHESLSHGGQRLELQFIEHMLSALWQLEQHNRIWPGVAQS